jgi:hypothetical protein
VLEGVRSFFADPALLGPCFETTGADHGRIEVRRHRVSHDVAWLFSDRAYPDAPRMPDLASIASVEARRTVDGVTTTEPRYYLSSARLTPERFAAAVRAHWTIENCLHWVLDETFDEDKARNRKDNGPENLPGGKRPSPSRRRVGLLRRRALPRLRRARRARIFVETARAGDEMVEHVLDAREHPRAQLLPIA